MSDEAAGSACIAATQRPSSGGAGGAVVGPRIRSAMRRLTFYLNQSSDYAIALDRPVRRLLPRVPGRGALIDGSGDIVILQALQISDEDIADVVARATRGRPSVDPSDRLDDAEPRRPTAAEIDRLEPLTTLRLIFRMQNGTTGSISVSVRGLMERVREEGFVAGRTERYTASLGVLEQLGILEAQWPGVPTSPRRITPGTDLGRGDQGRRACSGRRDSQPVEPVSDGVSEAPGHGHLTHAGVRRKRHGIHLPFQGRRPTGPAEQPAVVVQSASAARTPGGRRRWPPPTRLVRASTDDAGQADREVRRGSYPAKRSRRHPA